MGKIFQTSLWWGASSSTIGFLLLPSQSWKFIANYICILKFSFIWTLTPGRTLTNVSDSLFLLYSDSILLMGDASPCGNVRSFKSFGFDSKGCSKTLLCFIIKKILKSQERASRDWFLGAAHLRCTLWTSEVHNTLRQWFKFILTTTHFFYIEKFYLSRIRVYRPTEQFSFELLLSSGICLHQCLWVGLLLPIEMLWTVAICTLDVAKSAL